jgi:hypothetical protein
MITLIAAILITGGIVFGIEISNYRCESRRRRLHGIVVRSRAATMGTRDINYLLEHTGKYVEIGGRLVVNDITIATTEGFIPLRKVMSLLVVELGGI